MPDRPLSPKEKPEVGSVWERQSGPPLRLRVVDACTDQIGCRISLNGRGFGGVRPVPRELFDGKYFALVEAPDA